MNEAKQGNAAQDLVGKLLRRGNAYAENKEWGNAASAFVDALNELYHQGDGGQADDALAKLFVAPKDEDPKGDYYEPFIVADGDAEHDDRVKRVLHSLLNSKSLHPVPAEFVTLLNHPSLSPAAFRLKNVWTIVFRDREANRYPKAEGEGNRLEPAQKDIGMRFAFPRAPELPNATVTPRLSPSFVLIRNVEGVGGALYRIEQMTQRQADRIAYAWAHLAQAEVEKVESMYRVYQILDGTGIPAMQACARGFYRALLLRPEHPWTLAHLGEVFRDMANAWVGGGLIPGGDRLRNYVAAMYCYYEAIARDAGYAWAHAHLGAAVVNVRTFLRDSAKTPAIVKDLTDDLKDLTGDLVDAPDENITLINVGMRSLVRALDTQGFYYPWAHDYYGASLLIKSVLTQDPDMANLGQVVTAHALYLQPALLATVFEPDRLSVNPCFELAIIHFTLATICADQKNVDAALGHCDRAWADAWMGMKWLFKFHFQEELQGLSGCRLLASIGLLHLNLALQPEAHAHEDRCARFRLLENALIWDVGGTSPSFPIGQFPPTDAQGLLDFVEQSIDRFADRAVRSLTDHDQQVNVNTDVRMSLVATREILNEFRKDWLPGLDSTKYLPATGRMQIMRRLADYIGMINGKLKDGYIRVDEDGARDAQGAAQDLSTRQNFRPYIFSFIGAGSPSYALLSALPHPEPQ